MSGKAGCLPTSIWRTVNTQLDHTCKYLVVAVTFSVSVWFTPVDGSSVVVPVVVSMSVATAMLGKVVKRLVNQSRPAGARKLDAGMPSSHAISLAYLSTAGAASLLLPLLRGEAPCAASCLLAGAMVLAASYYSWLRVFVGHHTIAQVAVGYLFGASCALLVMSLIYAGHQNRDDKWGGRTDELPRWAKQWVLYASVAGCMLCMVKFGRKWIREDFSPPPKKG